MSLAADIMCDVGRAGAAFRRRQRQLRAFHRHEAMSVKLALATALHHSAQRVEVQRDEEEHAVYVGPRAQMAPPPGTRPAPLVEVAVPQGFWPGAPRQPGSGAPSLSPPVLADTTADGVDAGALAFLTRQAVETAELAKLEDKVAAAEVRLLDALQQDRDALSLLIFTSSIYSVIP